MRRMYAFRCDNGTKDDPILKTSIKGLAVLILSAILSAGLLGTEPGPAESAPTAVTADCQAQEIIVVTGSSVLRQSDGSYTASVSFRICANVEADDTLKVTVSAGEQSTSFALTPENAGKSLTRTFTGLAGPGELTVEIHGYRDQTYLSDRVMVPLEDRVLNIHKQANVTFDIYFAGDLTAGSALLGRMPTGEELDLYQTQRNWMAAITTDASGLASYNFTEEGQEDGVYLIVERSDPAVMEKVKPFYVSIPTADAEGWIYSVEIWPEDGGENGAGKAPAAPGAKNALILHSVAS